MTITPNQQSAIIGYWRSGAPIEQICWIMGKMYYQVEEIITNYQLKNNPSNDKGTSK